MPRGIWEETDKDTGELYVTMIDSDKTTWELKPGMLCEITGCSPAANRYGRKCKILRFEKPNPIDIVVLVQYLDTKGRAKYKNLFELMPIDSNADIEND